MQAGSYGFDQILSNMLPILWRRRALIAIVTAAAALGAFGFYSAVGERYEVYTLMRVGQGIKEKAASATNVPFGESVDMVSRIDSLARIGTTDQVIKEAMEKVGLERLFAEKDMTLFMRAKRELSALLGRTPNNSDDRMAHLEAIAALRELITARQEGRSDLLRISFKFPDPVVAADFMNELANSLVGAQAGLVQLPGADEFFHDQARRLEAEAEKAAADLKEFSVNASIYSAADQRSLLLKRADDLASLIATTRGSIQEKRGQKQAVVDQLIVLRPVSQSKTVSGIVNRLAGPEPRVAVADSTGPAQSFDEAPPLLLVKVYQDAMASLLKLNSDLNGSLRLEALLATELDSVNKQLADLTSKEAEYDRLKRVLVRATTAADHYGTRMLEEQISQDSAKKTQLSSVRVVQLADQPIAPMFPKASHLAFLALFGGLLAGAAISALLEIAQQQRQQSQQQNEMDRFVVSRLDQLSRRNAMAAAE